MICEADSVMAFQAFHKWKVPQFYSQQNQSEIFQSQSICHILAKLLMISSTEKKVFGSWSSGIALGRFARESSAGFSHGVRHVSPFAHPGSALSQCYTEPPVLHFCYLHIGPVSVSGLFMFNWWSLPFQELSESKFSAVFIWMTSKWPYHNNNCCSLASI